MKQYKVIPENFWVTLTKQRHYCEKNIIWTIVWDHTNRKLMLDASLSDKFYLERCIKYNIKY